MALQNLFPLYHSDPHVLHCDRHKKAARTSSWCDDSSDESLDVDKVSHFVRFLEVEHYRLITSWKIGPCSHGVSEERCGISLV